MVVDGRPIYFDRYPQKVQHFQGVTVYTPSNILNQSQVTVMSCHVSCHVISCHVMTSVSQVVIMFQSGAGVEVLENKGYMATRVYLPWTFIVSQMSQK